MHWALVRRVTGAWWAPSAAWDRSSLRCGPRLPPGGAVLQDHAGQHVVDGGGARVPDDDSGLTSIPQRRSITPGLALHPRLRSAGQCYLSGAGEGA